MHIPVIGGIITQTFARHKANQPTGSWGTDIGFDSNFLGEIPIYCCYDSVVNNYGLSDSFGNRVWTTVLAGKYAKLYIIYPHMTKLNIELVKGKLIKEGTILGYMGNSGLVYNSKTGRVENNNDGHISMPKARHLHIECRKNISDGLSSVFLDEIETGYKL